MSQSGVNTLAECNTGVSIVLTLGLDSGYNTRVTQSGVNTLAECNTGVSIVLTLGLDAPLV